MYLSHSCSDAVSRGLATKRRIHEPREPRGWDFVTVSAGALWDACELATIEARLFRQGRDGKPLLWLLWRVGGEVRAS